MSENAIDRLLLELSGLLENDASPERLSTLLLEAMAKNGAIEAASRLLDSNSSDSIRIGRDALRRLAEKGNLDAAYRYGIEIVNHDKADQIAAKKAESLLRAAAQGGVSAAWSYLGDHYADNGDLHKATDAWRKGIGSGDRRSSARLGCAHYLGKGVERDVDKAVLLIRSSGSDGGSDSAYILALALLAVGSVASHADARRILERLTDEGDPKAAFTLADGFYPDELLPADSGYAVSRKLYAIAFEAGIDAAAIPLANRYINSSSRLDKLLGFKILEDARDNGNSLAAIELASAYWNRGQDGDDRLARAALLDSAKEGDPVAQLVLGESIISGRFGFCSDVGKGVAWIQRAAESGCPDALMTLGARTYHGSGLKKDRQAGLQMIRHAAELGSQQAARMISELEKNN